MSLLRQVEVAVANGKTTPASEANGTKVDDPTLWEPAKADEQAKVVDILQALADYAPERKWRLGIVVSAWDIVLNSTPNVTPRAWIERNTPLLRQYLNSNPESFDVGIFGVSAQGGDPEKDAIKLQNVDTPSERVIVIMDEYKGHDLTRVVMWVTNKND